MDDFLVKNVWRSTREPLVGLKLGTGVRMSACLPLPCSLVMCVHVPFVGAIFCGNTHTHTHTHVDIWTGRLEHWDREGNTDGLQGKVPSFIH